MDRGKTRFAGLSASADYYDVVIAGGGVAGSAAAIALAQRSPDLSVLLLEREPGKARQRYRIGETLPPHVLVLFQQLGLLESFQAQGNMAAHGTRAIWGNETPNEYPFLFSHYGHGWHLDRAAFDDWLINQAQERGVTVVGGSMLEGQPRYYDNDWTMTIAGHSIKAKAMIDASGRSAALGRSQGGQLIDLDRLIGIYRFYQLTEDVGLDSYTLVESCVLGWWYSTYLPNRQLVVTLMTDSDIAREQGMLTEPGWLPALKMTQQSYPRLINAEPLTSIKAKPAHSQYLKPVCGTAWYAVGDAAATFDPLSSLGIFKALRHGLLVAYAIDDFIQGKSGSEKKYQQLMETEYRHYLKARHDYYQAERRFDIAPFWQRRNNYPAHTIAGNSGNNPD